MKKIKKKVWPEYFQRILDGEKKYELRLADFDCQNGDFLILKEWDPRIQDYTGRSLEKEVTFVIKTKNLKFWSQTEIDKYGYQIISFK